MLLRIPASAKESLLAPIQTLEGADSIRANGVSVWRWRERNREAYLLKGSCNLKTRDSQVHSDRMLLLVWKEGDRWRTTVLADGNVRVNHRKHHSLWKAELKLHQAPSIKAPDYRGKPDSTPKLLKKFRTITQASPQKSQIIQQVQYTLPAPQPEIAPGTLSTEQTLPPSTLPIPSTTLPPEAGPSNFNPPSDQPRPLRQGGLQFFVGNNQSVQIGPRSSTSPTRIKTENRLETNETIIIARGGVTVSVRDVQAQRDNGQTIDLGNISLSADRMIAWIPAVTGLFQGTSAPNQVELYLEGDIVFRQGTDRVIYAERMYYNVNQQYGMVLSAEAISPMPNDPGVIRLKADVLQQISAGEFVAFDAAITTSRLGIPRYWLQSEELRFSSRDELVVDRYTGLGTLKKRQMASSANNFVFIGGVPVLYWPVFSGDFQRSGFYFTDLKFKNDSVFGTQFFADIDLFQVFGSENPPEGVEWTLSTDYLSERGFALGTNLQYTLPSLYGLPGPVKGDLDIWGIDDDGLDFLGQDRRDLLPEKSFRGRVLARHRHYLPNDFELIAEIGLLSDRNFLEQYLESEWDHAKDHDTSLRLRKYSANHLFDLHIDVRLNDFFTETNQLPRFDHYGLGHALFGNRLTWSMHNQIGYADLEVADAPINPVEAAKFTPLPGEVNAQGLVAATRHEISAPIELGPVRVAPFLSGEAAFFGQDSTGNDRTRLLGQAGIRGTLPMWRLFPAIQSDLLNINGLAHKLEWNGEFFYADADADLNDIPLYDPLDDDAQEQFRRRFIFDTFGGLPLPGKYDPRTYAFRHGLQRNVTSPSTPIVDDLMQFRLGLNQRWQTKRGLPGRERIVDLARFDVEMLLFPKENRDNFGETLGPVRYDFRYHIGDRVTLLSDGYFDFFSEGLRSISAGLLTSRPGLGDMYVGFLSLEGPVSSNVLRGSVDYRMNEKWILSAGATFDLGQIGNVGQSLALTRIGESALLRMGVNVDEGRDNVSFVFGFEPRFWPKRRLGRLGGKLIPPPGVEGFE